MTNNHPLTVLHLCSIKGRGGTGYMASRLCRLLQNHGVRVIVGCCAGSKVEERSKASGLQLLEGLELRRGFRPVSLWHDVTRIRECLKTERVDLIHTWHSIEYWTAATALMGQGGKTLLARTRGLVTPVSGGFFNRLIHNRTALLHATCLAVVERYREAGLDGSRIQLVYDGVDLSRFHAEHDGHAMREALGIPKGAPVIASIGRLEAVKGHKYLLEAMAKLHERCFDPHLILAGDGSLREELEKQAAAAGIGGQLHFLGVRKDIPELLAACDLYVLSSLGSEGSSRATQEAMACGRPAVVTRVGMLPDIVREDETGIIVQPGDSTALADAIQAAFSNRERLTAWGKRALAIAQSEYDEQAFAGRIACLYKEALAQRCGK